MGEVVRSHSSEVPELLPCGYLVGDNVIKINLKGMAARKWEISSPGLETRLLMQVLCCWSLWFSFILVLPYPRCEREQYRQPRVWHINSEAHHPAVSQSVDGASSHHPLRTERNRQILPGRQVGRIHHFPNGAGGDRAQCGKLQRGPELQQGTKMVSEWRFLRFGSHFLYDYP